MDFVLCYLTGVVKTPVTGYVHNTEACVHSTVLYFGLRQRFNTYLLFF